MQPNQNEYNFIMQSPQNTSGPAFLQNPKQRNIIAVLFVVGILFIAVIVIAIFASLGSKNTSGIVNVAAYQTELVRISALGLKEARDPSTRAQAATLQSFTQSDLSQTTSYLGSVGKKFEKEDASLKLNTTVDKELESAALRNSFDEALLKAFDQTSAEYKLSLQKAINSASSDDEKAVLETAANNIITFEGP